MKDLKKSWAFFFFYYDKSEYSYEVEKSGVCVVQDWPGVNRE